MATYEAHRGVKKKPLRERASFLQGFREGRNDVIAGRPLRHLGTGAKDAYSRGYREGVRDARLETGAKQQSRGGVVR